MQLRELVDFRRLLVSQGASGLGDWMGTFAFIALVQHLTGSATAVGGILAFRLIPAALGGPLAARLVSRWDRRRTMITMDLMRAGMIAVIPFVQELWWVYLWAFMLETPSLVFLASRDSSVPRLVKEKDLPEANGLLLATSYGNIPIGAGVFAGFAALPFDEGWLGAHPHALVFWVDAVTFGVSALFIARIAGLRRGSEPETEVSDAAEPVEAEVAAEQVDAASGSESAPEAGSMPGSEAKPRLRDAWSVPLVRRVLPATASTAVGLGALFSLGIALVREELHASDAEFGVLIVLFGVGAVGGLLWQRRLGDTDLLTLVRYGTAVMGVVVAVMSLSPFVWLVFLGAAGFGGAATVALTSGMSSLQSLIREESQRVLAFAAFHVVIRVGLGVAALAVGVAGDRLNSEGLPGTRAVLIASGLLVLLSAATVRPLSATPTRGDSPSQRVP